MERCMNAGHNVVGGHKAIDGDATEPSVVPVVACCDAHALDGAAYPYVPIPVGRHIRGDHLERPVFRTPCCHSTSNLSRRDVLAQ